VLVVRGPRATLRREEADYDPRIQDLAREIGALQNVALVVVVDDSEFAARTLDNWLWVTFTRSDPACDVYGAGEFTHRKHWGCAGPLVIDARLKPHHPPALEADPAVSKRVDALAAPGGPLHGFI
jgi:4-hydroxy-3-polyprenylbenzoate decarboxylase